MNSQICVNCRNEKTVNSTDNRLVTESCGHIKCMDCLLHEKSGCSACLREKTAEQLKEPEKEKLCVSDSGPEDADLPLIYEKEGNESLIILYDELGKRKKPETSHIRIEQDANGKSYMCTVCKKRFNARSQVWYHAYCNGQRKPFQCPECNKSFASHSHFKYHMRVHRNERTYACEVCGDSFFQMSKLQRHKLKHTKEKNFSCVQCDKAFTNLSALRKHELTHSEARPFACGICSRRFRDSSNFKKHLAKHEDKKCTCGRGCSLCMSSGAQLELRAHQCPRCPRAFHSRKDMRRHAAVHTDSKPFRCKVCSRRFRRKDNLERHIRNTHPDYVPASAVDCDVSALKQLAANGHSSADTPKSPQMNEKSMLKILNPLPPLPDDVIQKHMCNGNEIKDEKKSVIDKSYILEANNARQSVIVGKFTFERKSPSPQGNEYVHKIRKANSMACQKNIPLPPIDEKKIIELERNTSLNNLDVGAPPKDVELYKKILYEKSEMYDKSELYEKSEIDSVSRDEEKTRAPASGPEMHWRRKMKLNINW